MKKFNPWHDVSPGDRSSDTVTGLIEISRGSRAKYEVDKESGMLKLDRVLYSSVYYPANYGFIPQTFCGDGDPLDILVLSQVDIVPMCLVKARVIGVMEMVDNGDSDDKVIAVAAGDPNFSEVNDISELPKHILAEIQNFFESYKKLEDKKVVVKNFYNRAHALKVLKESYEYYDKNFVKLND
jgi:inorganic pyrophosphatase